VLRGGCLRGDFCKERKRAARGRIWGWLLALFFLDGLVVFFNAGDAEGRGLGALRWLLEGRILQREKEGGEAEGMGLAVSSLFS